MGGFATTFVVSVSLIAQNIGTLPETGIPTVQTSTISSTQSTSVPRDAKVLAAEPFGASQIMVRMPAFTRAGAAETPGNLCSSSAFIRRRPVPVT